MSSGKLEVLKQNRDALLLAEVAAWLHDAGKFCDLHIESHADGGVNQWPNNYAYKVVVDDPTSAIHLSAQAANIRKPDIVNNALANPSPKAADFIDGKLKDTLKKTIIRLPNQPGYTLAELIMLGMPGFATHPQRSQLLDNKDGWLPAVLGVCHSEAHHDKQEPGRHEGKQRWPKVFASSPFGYEEDVVQNLSTKLQSLSSNLDVHDYRDVVNQLEKAFRYGLGDTRHPINEVTLESWSSLVAALFKSALATAILAPSTPDVRQWASRRDKLIDHDFRWRLLQVNFDVLGLYAKSIHIADLLGYQEAVRRACEEVKRLIEEEYPLGNKVYRDSTGIYFTFPDIELPVELEAEIRRRVEAIEPELAPRIVVGKGDGKTATEQLRTILANQQEKARRELVWPFGPANVSSHWQEGWERVYQGQSNRWEICPVCRLRPMEEDEDVCEHCRRRRTSRIQAWLKNPAQTIWLDEIADHNGRIALLVAKFGLDGWLSGDLVQTMLVRAVESGPNACVPKNPSPARLRRVWETCQGFWTETVEGRILAKHTYGQRPAVKALRSVRLFITPDVQTGWKEKVPYDGIIAGQPVSLLWDAEEKHFVTIINLRLAAGEIKTLNDLLNAWRGQKAEVGDPKDRQKRLKFTMQQVIPAKDDFGQYRPYLSLLTSPDQFLALVPADDAPEIAEEIRQKYVEQMGKVQNRLPLFLGLVFFLRKTPLIAAMDTARRMLEQSVFKEEAWTVECVKPVDGDLKCFVRLSRDDQRLQYQVPIKMGDQTTPDAWYPYFFFEGDPGPRRLRFRHNGRWLVHVRDLQEGDRVHVFPSLFVYVFLEHTAQRFAFVPNRDAVLLDELPRLMDMWRDICQTPDMTDTKLQGIWRVFGTKWDLWKPDSDPEGRKAFEELVRATFAREGITCVTVEDVLTKRFQRCLELHLRVLKRRVKEEQNEQRSETV